MLLPTEAECLPGDGASNHHDRERPPQAQSYQQRRYERDHNTQREMGHHHVEDIDNAAKLSVDNLKELKKELVSNAESEEKKEKIDDQITDAIIQQRVKGGEACINTAVKDAQADQKSKKLIQEHGLD